MTDKQRFASVWDAIEDTPQNAASMRARSGLMMSLTEVIRQSIGCPGLFNVLCTPGTHPHWAGPGIHGKGAGRARRCFLPTGCAGVLP